MKPPCPVCGSAKSRLLTKAEWMSLHACLKCRSNYQERLSEPEKQYNMEYFAENHIKAYGKSYIEDEANIRAFSKRRLETILKLLGKPGSLLDAGSALGLFCDEANHLGFMPTGAEISEYARNFAKDHFNIKCTGDFETIEGNFDAVTLWFTLEHIEKPVHWIKKAHSLLNKNGILGLSVPNGFGSFARFNKKGYFEKRPEEHWFEPSINGLSRLLKQEGFTIQKTEIFGLHPERIGLPNWNVVKSIQKILKLGDTFEIYARK